MRPVGFVYHERHTSRVAEICHRFQVGTRTFVGRGYNEHCRDLFVWVCQCPIARVELIKDSG